MNAKELLDEAKAAYMTMKRDRVKEEGVGADCSPTLIVANKEFRVFMQGPLDRVDLRHTMTAIMAAALKADAICLLTEAFYTQPPAGTDMDAYDRGNLAQRFAANDKAVLECLNASSCDLNGDVLTWTQPYRYGGAKVLFDLPIITTGEGQEGITPDCLRQAMAVAKQVRDGSGSEVDLQHVALAFNIATGEGMFCALAGENSTVIDMLHPEDRN